MKIRNPLKEYGQWRDDITQREKIAWSIISILLGVIIGWIIKTSIAWLCFYSSRNHYFLLIPTNKIKIKTAAAPSKRIVLVLSFFSGSFVGVVVGVILPVSFAV